MDLERNKSKLYTYCSVCNMTCNHRCFVNGEKYIYNCFQTKEDEDEFNSWYAKSYYEKSINIGPFKYFECFYDRVKELMDTFEMYYWSKRNK